MKLYGKFTSLNEEPDQSQVRIWRAVIGALFVYEVNFSKLIHSNQIFINYFAFITGLSEILVQINEWKNVTPRMLFYAWFVLISFFNLNQYFLVI